MNEPVTTADELRAAAERLSAEMKARLQMRPNAKGNEFIATRDDLISWEEALSRLPFLLSQLATLTARLTEAEGKLVEIRKLVESDCGGSFLGRLLAIIERPHPSSRE